MSILSAVDDLDMLMVMPIIRDEMDTQSSIEQNNTVQECLPFLHQAYLTGNIPALERKKHVRFLRDSLTDLGPGFTGFDASRAWILYWVLAGLSILGEDISIFRTRYVSRDRQYLANPRVSDSSTLFVQCNIQRAASAADMGRLHTALPPTPWS